jgi:cephalosporin-C deacetylase-like acetyl esterase
MGIIYNTVIYLTDPTQVVAYMGCPAGSGPFPGVVVLHGGGMYADIAWVQEWIDRGACAISMDLGGRDFALNPLPNGSITQVQSTDKYYAIRNGVKAAWPYHAAAHVMLARSLLGSLPQVDSSKIALHGVSWGGYLACLVAGIDFRYAVVAPIYGCAWVENETVWYGPDPGAASPLAVRVRARIPTAEHPCSCGVWLRHQRC